ncbi:ATP-binding protein [Paraburkholderia sp. MPAMCS5]|uniref:hybrid sensor histidine kinase/response regulator n=1 Tax=Paraburkholderia sp. MPAMCS5 TaxID=3112563 RepID=UPI002E183988|nr:ATP-binding protein [Paraburkholderia sp. MPAMCS5]
MDSTHRNAGPIGDAFEQAPCGLLSTATDGTIVRVNATFCRWLGFEAPELLDVRRIQDLLTMGGKVFHQTHWAPLLQMQRSVAEVKLEFRHRDGHKVPMLINAARRVAGDAELDDIACVIVNDRHRYEKELVHTRREAEDALQAKSDAEQALQLANRRKDEFLAMLAHELRNPLAPIQAAARLFGLKEFTDPQVLWSRGVLERQVAQLVRLVDDLLDVSRIAEGKMEFRPEHVELSAAVRRALEGSRGVLQAQSHQFSVRLPEAPAFVDADPVRLVQIVQNLLNNAAKYTPAGGIVELHARREGNEAVISVRDSGIGIAAENLHSVFGLFSQLPSGRSRSQGGLGIGLALVRALAEGQGGTVSVSSRGVNQGSEFTVRLPLSPVQEALAADKASERPREHKRRRIVIVDDSEDAALSLSMLLEADGYETRTATTGSEAVDLVFDFKADILLLDIGLPDMSGYEVARQIRRDRRGSSMQLIAVTGWSQEPDREAAFEAGFNYHLAKPVDYERLLSLLG